MTISAVGMFCDDIREEKGTFSLMGIYPDNLSIPDFKEGQGPAVLPRFCLYIRTTFDITEKIETLSVKLVLPDGKELPISEVADTVIAEVYKGAAATKHPLGTIHSRVNMSPFPVPSLGFLKAIVTVNGKEYLAAAARFNTDEAKEAVEFKSQSVHRF